MKHSKYIKPYSFSEGDSHIEPSNFKVLGVSISSSSGNIHEIEDMIGFVKEAKELNLSHYIKKLDYSTKYNAFIITLNSAVEEKDSIGRAIKSLVEEHFLSYHLFGNFCGDGLLEFYERLYGPEALGISYDEDNIAPVTNIIPFHKK